MSVHYDIEVLTMLADMSRVYDVIITDKAVVLRVNARGLSLAEEGTEVVYPRSRYQTLYDAVRAAWEG